MARKRLTRSAVVLLECGGIVADWFALTVLACALCRAERSDR